LAEIFVSHASTDTASAATVAAALRQGGHDVFLDSDRQDGITPGSEWSRTLFHKLRVCDAVLFLNSDASQASMWCHTELANAVDLGKRVYWLDLAPGLAPHPVLQAVQGIRFEVSLEDSTRRLMDVLRLDGLSQATGRKWDASRPPYPGLAPLDIDDAGVFFGREGDVLRLVERVSGQLGRVSGDLVVVMGPSGAGKSSLVRAGLLARLSLPGRGWVVIEPFEPGPRPLDRLVNRLVAADPAHPSEDECLDRLRSDGLATYAHALVDHVTPRATRLLITLDQGEQLSTITQPAERAVFLDLLGSGLGPASPVSVVMTIRSDRFDDVQRLPTIGPAMKEPFIVGPLSEDELGAVIEGPARRADLTFGPGVVGHLIRDTMRGSAGHAVNALPLLTFTLRAMYDRAMADHRRVITEDDYEQVGRIEGAIAQRAKIAEAALPVDSGALLDRLLPRFVTLSEERLPAARTVSRKQLSPTEEAIVEALEDQRLLTGENDTVRLAHEQLITAWPALARTVTERRDEMLMEARLERQAGDWKHGAGELLGRDSLHTATPWLERRGRVDTGDDVVTEYIVASQRAAHRRRRVVIGTLGTIGILALVAVLFAAFALVQGSDARKQSHVAQADQMAAEATALFSTDTPLGMLVSSEAYDRAPSPQAQRALDQAAEAPLQTILRGDGALINDVAYSPNGSQLATGDGSGRVTVWNVAKGTSFTLHDRTQVETVAFSPNGTYLATGDGKGDVVVHDLATKKSLTFDDHSLVHSVAFSPNSQNVAIGDQAGHVVGWDLTTGKKTTYFTEPKSRAVRTVAYSGNGEWLGLGDDDDQAVAYNLTSGAKTYFYDIDPVNSVAFSPNSDDLAIGDDVGEVSVWNLATGFYSSYNDDSEVWSLAYSPDGQNLATGDDFGGVVVWNLENGTRSANFDEVGPVWSVAYDRNGQQLATAENNGDVAIWDPTGDRQARSFVEGSPIDSVAFSANGHELATGNDNGFSVAWDVATGDKAYSRDQGYTIRSVAYSRNGRYLATGNDDGEVVLLNLKTGTYKTYADRSAIETLAFSRNGRHLATGDAGGVAVDYNLATGKIRQYNDRSTIDSVAFSPDGRRLATADHQGDVVVWDLATHQKTSTPDGSQVESVAYSSDGRYLATGDDGGSVVVRNESTGATRTFDQGSEVHSVAFSPDGRYLATGGTSGIVTVYDLTTGSPAASFDDGSAVADVTFSLDGRKLAFGGQNGNVVQLGQVGWTSSTASLERTLCSEVRGNLSPEQWRVYVPVEAYQRTCATYASRAGA
jgi:WD40 repeat protein